MKPFLPLPNGHLSLTIAPGRNLAWNQDAWQRGTTESAGQPALLPTEGTLRIELDHFARPVNKLQGSFGQNWQGRGPLLLENAQATQHMFADLRASAYKQGPWRTALTQLSWMPHTEFANKANISAFSRSLRGAADWGIYAVGLALGLAALPTLVPLFRCARAYVAVQQLRQGLDDVNLAMELYQQINRQQRLSPAFAEDALQVFRSQACLTKLFAVKHRSSWSAFVDAELVESIDRKLPGFSMKMKAQDAALNRRAQQAQMAAAAGALLLDVQASRKHMSGLGARNDLLLRNSLMMLAANA